MAGVAPQRGSNATTIGMVVAIIVAVLLLGALIWLFTMQEKLRTEAEQAKQAKTAIALSGDESAARQLFPAHEHKSLVAAMNAGVKMLCGALTGNQEQSPAEAMQVLNTELADIADQGYVADPDQMTPSQGAIPIIRSLYEQLVAEQSATENAEVALKKAQEELDALAQANKNAEDNFQKQIDDLKAQVEQQANAKSEFERTKTEEIDELARQISEKQDRLDETRQERAQEMSRVRDAFTEQEQLLAEQRAALQELRGPGPITAQPLAAARKPIGKVARALPGDSLVHIDLGKRDNVSLGMTFSVYSQGERVLQSGQGKATLEVVSIGELTAECRVISPPPPDDPILEGDGVGNIILSRNRDKKTQFVVVGDFDIDFDGQTDVRGRAAIEALIRAYGGEVVDQVTAFTDYVVVGSEPAGELTLPVNAAAGGPSVAEAAQAEAPAEAAEEEEWADEEDEGGWADEEEPADEEDAAEDDEWADEEEAGEEDDEWADEEEAVADDEWADEEEAVAEDDEWADEEEAAEEAAPQDITPIRLPREESIDPTRSVAERRAMTARDKYYDALNRAQMFSIPRLPQDRFLSFVGVEPGTASAKRLQE